MRSSINTPSHQNALLPARSRSLSEFVASLICQAQREAERRTRLGIPLDDVSQSESRRGSVTGESDAGGTSERRDSSSKRKRPAAEDDVKPLLGKLKATKGNSKGDLRRTSKTSSSDSGSQPPTSPSALPMRGKKKGKREGEGEDDNEDKAEAAPSESDAQAKSKGLCMTDVKNVICERCKDTLASLGNYKRHLRYCCSAHHINLTYPHTINCFNRCDYLPFYHHHCRFQIQPRKTFTQCCIIFSPQDSSRIRCRACFPRQHEVLSQVGEGTKGRKEKSKPRREGRGQKRKVDREREGQEAEERCVGF